MNVFRLVTILILSGGLLLQCQNDGQKAQSNSEVSESAAAKVQPEQAVKAIEHTGTATNEEPTVKEFADVPEPKPTTTPKPATLNLGDTEVAVAETPPATTMVSDNNWGQLLGDYDRRRSTNETGATSTSPPPKRFFYEKLSIHTYLEDVIAFHEYFKYKAYEIPITGKEKVELPASITDDRTDKELAYPVVREQYQSDYSFYINNPTYLPLQTEGISPDLLYNDTIAHFQQIKNLYDLLIVPQNEDQEIYVYALSKIKEELFFEEALRGMGATKRGLEETLTVIFDDAIEKERGKIIWNRYPPSTDGTAVYVSEEQIRTGKLEDWEEKELITAMENKPLPESVNEPIEQAITRNQQILTFLENQIETVKMKYEATASLLNSSEHTFFQQVFTAAESEVVKQEDAQQELVDFMENLDDKSCFPLLFPIMGLGIKGTAMPSDGLWTTYDAAKNIYYQKVRALEATFKQKQAEH